jgi:hypothetical protein
MPRAARGRWPGTRRRRWMPGHAPSSGCRGPASGSGARDPPRGGQESPVAERAKVRSLRAIHADGGREDRQSPGRPTIPRQSLPRNIATTSPTSPHPAVRRHNCADVVVSQRRVWRSSERLWRPTEPVAPPTERSRRPTRSCRPMARPCPLRPLSVARHRAPRGVTRGPDAPRAVCGAFGHASPAEEEPR